MLASVEHSPLQGVNETQYFLHLYGGQRVMAVALKTSVVAKPSWAASTTLVSFK